MRGTASERAGVEYALCLRTVRGLSADSLWTFFLTDEMSSELWSRPTVLQLIVIGVDR